MNGDTFSIKAPKERSKKLVAAFKGKFLNRGNVLRLPSDTKLLLTKNYSEIIIFVKITNFTRYSLKKSLFPGDFESAKCLKSYEKYFSGNYFRNNLVSEGILFVLRRSWGASIEEVSPLKLL